MNFSANLVFFLNDGRMTDHSANNLAKQKSLNQDRFRLEIQTKAETQAYC